MRQVECRRLLRGNRTKILQNTGTPVTYLFVFRKGHHQFRPSQRQFITPVDLPEMERFPIESDDLSHLRRLCYFPNRAGHDSIGQDEHA